MALPWPDHECAHAVVSWTLASWCSRRLVSTSHFQPQVLLRNARTVPLPLGWYQKAPSSHTASPVANHHTHPVSCGVCITERFDCEEQPLGRHTSDTLRRNPQVFLCDVRSPAPARLLFEEPDPASFVQLGRTKDWQYLVVNVNSKLTSEVSVCVQRNRLAVVESLHVRNRPTQDSRCPVGIWCSVHHELMSSQSLTTLQGTSSPGQGFN